MLAAVAYGIWSNPEEARLDEAARAGSEGQFVTLSRGMTHYDVAGPDSGRVVVLLHEFSVPYYIWDPTSAALAEAGYRVLRYDMYGRGLSDRPDADYTLAFYDAQLMELLDSLRIESPVDIAGVSFGGVVAAQFAASHPSRTQSLVLVDPAIEDPSVEKRSLGPLGVPVLGRWLFQTVAVPGMAEGQAEDFFRPEDYPGWSDRYRPQMRYEGFGRALHSTVINTHSVDLTALYSDAASTGVPTLVVWGKQDEVVPFSLSSVVLNAVPQAEFAPVDSAGHLPHIEQAPVVNARLLDFLASHGAGAE